MTSLAREELRQMSAVSAEIVAYLKYCDEYTGNLTTRMEEIRRDNGIAAYTVAADEPSKSHQRLREIAKQAAVLAAYMERCETEWDAAERGRAQVISEQSGERET